MATVQLDPQICTCGNDTYKIQLISDEEGTGVVAACDACDRITGTVGKGLDYRGRSLGTITDA